MNTKFIAIFSCLALYSAQAVAMHAYHDETCSMATPKGELKLERKTYLNFFTLQSLNNEPLTQSLGGLFLNLANAHDVWVPEYQSLILDTLREENRTELPYDDGCFQGTQGTFVRQVDIVDVTPALRAETGLQAGGATVPLSCSYEHITPSGPDCDP